MEVVKTIKGKRRGFKFTMLTLQKFSDHTGVEFSEIKDYVQNKTLDAMITLLLAANTVYTKGKDGTVSKYDVDDWITEMSQQDFQEIFDCFIESTKQIVKKIGSGNTKKK